MDETPQFTGGINQSETRLKIQAINPPNLRVMKVQIGLFSGPEETIEQINKLLTPHGLWICTTEEKEDDEPECVAYEVLTIKK